MKKIELLTEGEDGRVVPGTPYPDCGPRMKFIPHRPPVVGRCMKSGYVAGYPEVIHDEEAVRCDFTYRSRRITFYVPRDLMAPEGLRPTQKAERLAGERVGLIW